jgi:serine protease inhibitor
MNKTIFLSLLSAFIFWQCDTASNEPAPYLPVTADMEQAADMNQTLGWDLFHQEQQALPQENILISPYSVQTALFMAQNGAQGSTLGQMLDLMDGSNASVESLNQAHKQLSTLLTTPGDHPEVTVANSYFYDSERIDVEQAFLNPLSEFYAASSESLDFRQEEQSKAAINNWVSEKTNGKIPTIVEEITSEDVAFLINALYFKADWMAGFPEELTFDGTFQTAAGGTAEVPFVNQDASFLTAQADGLHMVDLPFKDSTYSLTLIMPDPEQPDAQWPTSLTKERWLALYDAIQPGRAIVQFPKLKLEYGNNLVGSLRNLGMEDAFSPALADFQLMGSATNGQNIFIKQIAHKAVLEVDEQGAEGAAATSIGFGTTSLPPFFRFDQPFVLVLRHIETNTMLFTGYVADPSVE